MIRPEGKSGPGVVAMVQHMTGNPHGNQWAPLRQVEAYWDALRQGARVPLRRDVDPRGIEGALAQAFILERIAPGLARLRVAGSQLGDLMGMEVRGMPLSSLFAPAIREEVARALEQVFTAPARAELALEAGAGFGRPALAGRMLVLPLASDGGVVDRALGCLVTQGATGRAPRRFDGCETRLHTLGPAGAAPAPAPEPGFAEAAATFAGQAPGRGRKTRVPWLRVIESRGDN